MPTYDYECQKCGHTFEAFQSMKDKPLRVCPQCSARRLRRLIGAGAAVIFKGSGFYQTDYRSAEYNEKRNKEENASSVSASESSGKSSEGKETKKESKNE